MGGSKAPEDGAELGKVALADAVLLLALEQVLDDIRHACRPCQVAKVAGELRCHGGERLSLRNPARPHVVLHRRHQRQTGFLEQLAGSEERLAVVRLQVGHLLHPRLDSLRNKERLLLGRLKAGEHLAQPLAFPVVGDAEPQPAARV